MKYLNVSFLLSIALLIGSQWTSQAATTNVSFGSFFFNPKDVTIHVGDSVMWSGPAGHTVDPFCGAVTTCTHTFDSTGNFPYQCSVLGHASLGMTGIVRVVEAPAVPALLSQPAVNEAGQFEFTVSSTANRTNIIEATTNAASVPVWVPVATLIPTNATFRYTDTNTEGFHLKLYRVVQPE